MFYPIAYPQQQTWLPNLSQQIRQWLAALTTPAPLPMQLPAGDLYHLEAGVHRLHVRAGTVWVPEVGLFNAGETVTLTVDTAGLALHAYAQQTTVVAVTPLRA